MLCGTFFLSLEDGVPSAGFLQRVRMGEGRALIQNGAFGWEICNSSSLEELWNTMEQPQSDAAGKEQGMKQGSAACNTILQG